MPHPRQRAVAVATLLAAALAALGVGEAVLRRVDRQVGIARIGWTGRSSPLSFERGARDWNFNEMDARGRSIRFTDGDVVVVLVGDSQVEAAALPAEDMPEVALERALAVHTTRPVRVVSLAASGWGQDQALLVLERYLERYRADVVVQWLTPGNDLWENSTSERTTDGNPGPRKPTFILENGMLIAPRDYPGSIVDGSALWQLARRAWLRDDRGITRRPELGVVPEGRIVRDDGCAGLTSIKWTDYYGNDVADELEVDPGGRYLVSTGEAIADGRTHFGSRFSTLQPVDEYQRDLMAALLARTRRVAVDHGASYLAIHVESGVQRDSARRVVCVEGRDGSLRRLDPDERRVLGRVVPAGSLVSVALDGFLENHVSRTDRHLSAVGNERAMRALAEELVARGIVPRG